MSEGYATGTALVGAESTRYDRALDTAIALSVVGFVLGVLTLVRAVTLDLSGGALADFFLLVLGLGVGGIATVAGLSYLTVVPVTSRRVRGIGIGLLVGLVGLTAVVTLLDVTLATVIGLLLLVQAAVVCAAGLASWRGLVDTEPSASPGLLAGAAFGLVGCFVGAAIGGTLLPGGTVAYLASAAIGGLALAALTIVPREDLGSALPVALLVGTLGAVVVTGTIDLGWTFSPGEHVDGDFTGGVVVPLFALLGSIVASWGAAKARAGYGARGRQYGAFLVVYLNAALMVAIMVAIVAFVVAKGLAYAFHGITIGALSGLVVLTPALVLALDWARTPAGSETWHLGARQFVRVAPLAVLGGAAGLLAFAQLTGTRLSIPFQFTALDRSNREVVLDTAASITTTPVVGNLLLVVVGTLVGWYFLRKYGSLRGVGTRDERVAAVERGVGLVLGGVSLLVIVLVLPLPAALSLPVVPVDLPVGVAGALATTFAPIVVWLASLAAGALALAALGTLLSGDVAERGTDRAQLLRVGLFGALGLLAGAVLLEPTGAVNPTLGPADLVPMVALLAALAAFSVAGATAVAARSRSGRARRILRREAALGLAVAAGSLAVVGLHVALTGAAFSVGPVTVGFRGTFNWPMTMQPYVPLATDPGGILPAVVGTVWLVIGATLFAVPLGVGAAVFLTEYAEQGRVTSLVEVATNALWSTPSIVFGLFGAAFLIPRLGGDESLLSGMLVLGFMLLPLVLITSREAIKSVPDEYRDASAALGVSQWETIKSVVIPAAMPGVITGAILGIGRIAGETAPLLLVLGSTLNSTEAQNVLGGFRFVGHPPFVENPVLLESAAALPTQVWAVIAAGVSGSPSMGWGSALVLLMVVLTFYAVGIAARTYFRRKLDYE